MRATRAAGLDVGAVLVFVAIGRANHDEATSLTGLAGTAWPFLGGLALGWLLTRTWRDPAAIRLGAGIWLSTVAAGMGLRAVSGEGTAVPFIVVATTFLGVTLVGWRLIARARSSRPSRAAQRAHH